MHGHWTTSVVIELLCSYWTNQKRKKDAKMTWKLLTDENLVSLPIFSFPKPFSHRNEFKSMSIKKRKKGRRRRERQGNRSKFCLLYIQIAELSNRTQPPGRIINSILGNFHSSSQSDGGHKMARLHKYLFLFFHAFKKQESRHLKLLIVFI